jgi:hypothetical protein
MPFIYDVTETAMRDHVERTFGPWIPDIQQEIINRSFDPTTTFALKKSKSNSFSGQPLK